MAVEKIDLEVVTPERLVLSETVDEIVLPGREGYLGVLPGHAPLLTSLIPGEIAYRAGQQRRYLSVTGGFVEVLPGKVTILAQACERAEEIDLERAKRARSRAEEAMARRVSESEFRQAEVKLRRAIARIQVKERIL